MHAPAIVQHPNLRFCTAFVVALFDRQMLASESRNLRQVGDAKNLLTAREGFQLLAYRFRGAPADANVDFVEDQGARSGVLLL